MREPSGPTSAVVGLAHRVVPYHSHVATKTNDAAPFTVKLGARWHKFLWGSIFLLHTVCAFHCFAAAVLLDGVSGMMIAWFLDFYELTLPIKYFHAIAVGHFIVGSIHSSFVFVAISQVIYRTILRFRARKVGPRRTSSTLFERVSSQIPQTLERRMNRQLKRVILVIYCRVFSPSGLLGVEFAHFETVFFVREAIETLLQSHQAYQMCRLLTRPYLNRFFVAMLVVNCWTTPLLHRFVRKKPLQRLLAHICDVILDFVSAIVVPVVLVLDYVRDYDPALHTFAVHLWYNDIWYIRAVKEVPLLFFSSWLDVVSRLVFSLGLLSSIHDVKRLLDPAPVVKPRKPSSRKRPASHQDSRTHRLLEICHRLMAAYGFGILAVHLHAETRPTPASACVLVLKPWFVSQSACALFELNCCRQSGLTGDAIDFDRLAGALDPRAPSLLAIRHCPALEIQPRIQEFSNLIGVKLYNSTLIKWETDAALAEQHHAKLRFLYVIRSRFPNATLPAGLISFDFPRLVRDVRISETNIQWIPDDLDMRWPEGIQLTLERSMLAEYPHALVSGHFDALGLMYNNFSEVPASAFEAQGPYLLMLSANPINTLPEDVDFTIMTISAISIYQTNVSKLPSWMVNESFWDMQPYVMAGYTPLCDIVIPQASSEEIQSYAWLRNVDCSDYGPDFASYPFDLEAQNDEKD